MSYVMCKDPENENNYLILANGKAEIYRDVGGEAKLFSPLQQIRAWAMSADGGSYELAGRYDSPPAVFAAPNGVKTYDGGFRYFDQKVEFGDISITSLGDGKYAAAVTGGVTLSIPAGENVFYPITDMYEQQYSLAASIGTPPGNYVVAEFGTKTYGPYYIPGLTWAKSALSGAVMGEYTAAVGYGAGIYDAMIRETDITFSIGISSGTSAPSSWGSQTIRAPYASSVPTFVMEAETSGSGNYLWFRVSLSIPTQNFTHIDDTSAGYGRLPAVGPYPLSGFLSFSVAGANVTRGAQTASSGGNVTVVEVG